MSATADVARMLTLVPWLIERPGASIEEISSTFGVTATTIRRDLEQLDFCGLPGLGGGDLFDVSLVGDRVVVSMADELRRPLKPTPSEALRLVLTVDAVTEVLGDELPALRSAIAKVRRALGVPEEIADVLEAGGGTTVGLARRAVFDRRRVRLAYQGRTDAAPSEREIDPWALHVVDGVWYLQGHDHSVDDRRTFRLDRVAAFELLDVDVEGPAPDELPAPRYVAGAEDLEVLLEVSPQGRWLMDALQVDSVEERSSGGARIRLRTDAPQWLAGTLLMAGTDVEVIEPEELAGAVEQRAREAVERYRR